MERKNLKGQPREVVNEELAKCARAWKRIQDSLPVDTVDEEELARQHLQRRS